MQPAGAARLAAAAIPGARYLEIPRYSADAQVRERRGLAGAIEEVVTGTVSVRDDDRVLAEVLFTDIVDSTEKMAELGDLRWKELLDEHDRLADEAVDAARRHVVRNTGDGMLAYFDGAALAVGCVRAMMADARRIGLPLPVSVHVGDCERRGDDIGGTTVHIAARVLALSGANEVLVTSTVRDALVDIATEARDETRLRAVPGSWLLFVVG